MPTPEPEHLVAYSRGEKRHNTHQLKNVNPTYT